MFYEELFVNERLDTMKCDQFFEICLSTIAI